MEKFIIRGEKPPATKQLTKACTDCPLRRRYWMHLRLECTRDYWGDYDTDVEPLSIKRA